MIENNTTTPKSHNTRNGVLWILSPFITLLAVLLINVLVRLTGIESSIFDLISVLAGMAGVILLIVGPIVGIVKLARN